MAKKAITLLLLLGLSLMVGLPAFASAGSEPSITLSIDKKNTSVGSVVKVTLTGSSLTDVYAYEAVLRYDVKRLKLKSAASLVDGFTVQPIVKDGTVTLAHTKTGSHQGNSGTAALASLTFTALAPGSAEVSLDGTKLVDSELNVRTIKGDSRVKAAIGGPPKLRDIAGHWAEASIIRAVELGIVQGYDDDRFLPDHPVTRGEFAVMLTRALSPETDKSDAPAFKDAAVMPAWTKDGVAAASESGWITGYADRTFRAGQPISRAELAVMGVRALGWSPDDTLKLTFADANDVASWSRPYVALAAERKLMGGRSGNLFAPQASTTRAEAAAILIRLLEVKTNEGG